MAKIAAQEELDANKIIEALDALSAADITSVINAANEKRSSKIEQARRELIEETRAKAAQLGLSFEDLMRQPEQKNRPSGDSRNPAPIKFRGPGGESWSGRGKMPTWLKALTDGGHSREDFAVKE